MGSAAGSKGGTLTDEKKKELRDLRSASNLESSKGPLQPSAALPRLKPPEANR